MKYTDEQKAIAKIYEIRAFRAMHDEAEYKKIMDEFYAVKKQWGEK